MAVSEIDAEALGSTLAMLWERHRGTNLDRITLVEQATANVLRGIAQSAEVAAAAGAAHKLAGSLGTFGFEAGSRAALEAETFLRMESIDHRLLAEAVASLRDAVDERAQTTPVMAYDDSERATITPDGAVTHLVSTDADLVSRLTAAGAAVGIAVTSSSATLAPEITGATSVVIDADDDDPRLSDSLASTVSRLSEEVPVIVLTDDDGFERRVELARAGAVAIIPRSQGARLAVAFLAETIHQRTTQDWNVVVLNTDPELVTTLRDALPGPKIRLRQYDSAPAFWAALERYGADLIVVDGTFDSLSVPDLCRVLRSDPRWRSLPVVAYGPRRTDRVSDAIVSGLDDYLSSQIPTAELGCRLRTFLERSRSAMSRADTDSLTGTANRDAAERAIDRGLRLAGRHNESFTYARVTVDRLDDISESEGRVVSDLVLRRLGTRLLEAFRAEDIVGRWTNDGFAVGLYGATREQGRRRINEVLEDFGAEEFRTTSGELVRFDFRAGVAAFPDDGTTLVSLERTSETALERAVQGGERIATPDQHRSSQDNASMVDVILVEDDDSVADVIEHALRLRGRSLRRFSDGAEAAAQIGEGHARGRIILLDVGLPSLDGFGVLQQLGSHGLLESSHLIMLTARSSETERLRALGLGATEHITKPFSVPLLLGRLDQILEAARS